MSVDPVKEKRQFLEETLRALERDLRKVQQESAAKIESTKEAIKKHHDALEATEKELKALEATSPQNVKLKTKINNLKIERERLKQEFDNLKSGLREVGNDQKINKLLTAITAVTTDRFENINNVMRKLESLKALLTGSISKEKEKTSKTAIEEYLEILRQQKRLQSKDKSEIGQRKKPPAMYAAKLKVSESSAKSGKENAGKLKIQYEEVETKPQSSRGTTLKGSGLHENSHWVPFFKHHVTHKIKREQPLTLSVDVKDMTQEKFKEVCGGLEAKLKHYPDSSGATEALLKNCVVKEKTNSVYQIHAENRPLIELSHAQKKHKIDIVLMDREAQDESLFLMVASAKNFLETRNKREFYIEYCEEKPEIALKLYLVGKSLGLEPIFKDRPGFNKTEEMIDNVGVKLKIGNEEKSFSEIYKEAKILNAENTKALETLKDYIEKLEIDESTKPRLLNQ